MLWRYNSCLEVEVNGQACTFIKRAFEIMDVSVWGVGVGRRRCRYKLPGWEPQSHNRFNRQLMRLDACDLSPLIVFTL